jgi:hypothetical protein
MAALDDLNAALTTISTAVSDAATEIQALVAKLGTSSDPAVEAAATQLQTLATNLEDAVAAAKTASP